MNYLSLIVQSLEATMMHGKKFLRGGSNQAFLMSMPQVLGKQLYGSSASSMSPGFSHSPAARISALISRFILHPTSALQAGFKQAIPILAPPHSFQSQYTPASPTKHTLNEITNTYLVSQP
jgi:hypothetical protein